MKVVLNKHEIGNVLMGETSRKVGYSLNDSKCEFRIEMDTAEGTYEFRMPLYENDDNSDNVRFVAEEK